MNIRNPPGLWDPSLNPSVGVAMGRNGNGTLRVWKIWLNFVSRMSKMKKIGAMLMAAMMLMSCGQSGNAKEEVPEQDVQAQEAPVRELKPLTLAFVGDIMMGTTYPADGHYLTADDGATLFADTDSILRAVDIAAGNLEGSLFDGVGTPKKCSDPSICFAFKMPTRYARHLVDAGFDFVGIANNHINDFGPEAVSSTQKVLGENGIAYAGLRLDCPTAMVEKDGRKIGFAAFGHSRGTLSINDYEEVRRTVEGLRDSCDFVVVSFHGGGEGKDFQHVPHASETAFGENRGNVEKFAHAAIDAGADIVYGHGPHVNRALELYNDRLIIYSLGNFCTPYRMGLSGVSGYAPIVTATLNPDGTFAEGKIHSFIQQKGVGPRKDLTNSVAQNMRRLTKADFPNTPLSISDDGVIKSVK